MKSNQIIFLLLLLLIAGFLTFRISYSYFSDSGSSTENILAASAEFPTATPTNTPTPTITPTPQIANHVVISEVQLSGVGTGNSENDFVEFYNPTSNPFNLNGHRLVKRLASSPNDTTMKSWTSDAFIPAHGFYLWANTSIATLVGADASTSASFTTNNSIALRFGDEDVGVLIDSLSWNPAAQSLKEGTESPNPGEGQSLERKAYSTSTSSTMGSGGLDETKGNGFDANNNLTDFYIRAASQPQNTSSTTETP